MQTVTKQDYSAIDNNGLRLCKSESGKHYKIVHIATGKDTGLIATRLRDLKPVFEYLAPRFPWGEWGNDCVPVWGNDAFNAVLCQRANLDRLKHD